MHQNDGQYKNKLHNTVVVWYRWYAQVL